MKAFPGGGFVKASGMLVLVDMRRKDLRFGFLDGLIGYD